MQSDIENVEDSKELTTIHRALWKALIIEVARLFDTHNNVISFKKIPSIKTKIDKYHSEAIIGKIIKTRNTFTAHFADNAEEITSASEICKSRLRNILDDLSNLAVTK